MNGGVHVVRIDAASGPVGVVECPEGPLLVRGAGRVEVDGRSRDVERPVVAICRCGGSARFPFCDATHKLLNARKQID